MQVKAAGFLLTEGFLAGFCLSTGHTRFTMPRAGSAERHGDGGELGWVSHRYETDGRRMAAEPLLAADKTGTGGVRVSIGRWLF